MNEGACVLEHSVEADVSVTFAWNFWTDITNWDDPPAQFTLMKVAMSVAVRGLSPGPRDRTGLTAWVS